MAIDIEAYGRQFLADYEENDFEVTLTKYRKKKIVEILQKYNTSRILEIGCGMEPFFLTYNNFDYMTVVEPASVLYNSAKKYSEDSKLNVECIHDFVQNRVEELKEKTFDIILLIGLIHEVEDAQELMDAVKNICHKGTKVIITTNNPKSFHLTLAYESGIIPQLGILTDKAKSFQRNKVFTMEEMKELAKANSFTVLEEGSYFIKPFSHKQMKELLDNHIITEAVLEGFDKMIKYMPDLGAENYCVVELV